jgi:hypothetical protein
MVFSPKGANLKSGIIGQSKAFVKINLSGKISMKKMEILPDKLIIKKAQRNIVNPLNAVQSANFIMVSSNGYLNLFVARAD